MLTQSVEHAVTKDIDAARRRVTAVLSRQELDRQGDVIITDGIDASQHNGVVLIDHEHNAILGRLVRHWKTSVEGAPAWLGEIEVLPAGVSPRADQTWGELEARARRGWSIGFQAKEADYKPMVPGQTGQTFHRIAIMEVSSVAIPACQSCLTVSKHCETHQPRASGGRVISSFAELEADMKSQELSQELLLALATPEGAAELVSIIRQVTLDHLRKIVAPAVQAAVRRAKGRID